MTQRMKNLPIVTAVQNAIKPSIPDKESPERQNDDHGTAVEATLPAARRNRRHQRKQSHLYLQLNNLKKKDDYV